MNDTCITVYYLTLQPPPLAEYDTLCQGDTDSVFWNVWPDREADAACRQEAFSIADKLVLAIAKIYENDGKQHIALEFENVIPVVFCVVLSK